jgi:splicing factor U2AF subunit
MSRSSWLKEKDEKGSRNYCDEGSAARTRPFSIEEIMLRRENKKLSENVEEVAAEVGNISREGIIEDVSDRFESERGYKENKDTFPTVEKHVSEKSVKVSSRKKEENSSMKKDAVVKGKDRESCESDTKLKDKKNKDLSSEAKLGKNDRQIHGRRKDNEWLTDDSANEAEKKHSRDLASKDRHADRSRGKSERESKRKYRNGDDEKNRDWNTAKKHDQGKHRDLDVSERRERKELSKSRFEDSRLKRRRSRSQEREARSRRSNSISPRAHKPKSHHGGEHREFSSHSLKDRSGRQHSDIDRNRVSSNGSSSHYQRHGGYTSRLGGYSPRKRRIESTVKTSSPSSRSPEKKSAGWDLPPVGTAAIFSGPVTSNAQSSNQDVASTVNEIANAVSVSSTAMMSLSGVSNALSTKTNAPIDSVQLTQATRPMRRLYVENIPSSASEKAVMECFNNFLLSYGATRVQGTQPCFNCVVSVTFFFLWT